MRSSLVPVMPRRASRRAFAGLLLAAAVSVTAGVVAAVPGVAAAQAAPAVPVAPPPLLPAAAYIGGVRRVIYDMGSMHVWLVDWDGTVVRDYPVSGHKSRVLPGVGEFWVFSKSRYTGVANSPTRMEFMVRFAVGNSGAAIGFHSIPTKHGRAIQSVDQLGEAKSAGCVRQSVEDAQFLFDWAVEGTKVFVVDSSNRVPAARPRQSPRGVRPFTPIELAVAPPPWLVL